MVRKRIYFSTIDKDVRRVLGKRLVKECEDFNGGWLVAERSNGDAEYHLTPSASDKLKKYMKEHKRSRLYRAWTGDRTLNVRFEVDSW